MLETNHIKIENNNIEDNKIEMKQKKRIEPLISPPKINTFEKLQSLVIEEEEEEMDYEDDFIRTFKSEKQFFIVINTLILRTLVVCLLSISMMSFHTLKILMFLKM